jgi:hypothetical protein
VLISPGVSIFGVSQSEGVTLKEVVMFLLRALRYHIVNLYETSGSSSRRLIVRFKDVSLETIVLI